ncbi:MAG: YIP1 family protein [Dehalococcoidia bacterium]
MIQRMIRAARLDGRVFEEVRDDPTATSQALWVILLGGFALALGGIIGFGTDISLTKRLLVLVLTLSSAVVEWSVVSLLASWIGRLLLGRIITFQSMLRVLGFASVPWIFSLLILMRFVADLIIAGILVWFVVTLIVAFRGALRAPFWISFPMATFGFFIALSIRQMFRSIL